jgi:hypothetical protein
MRLFLFLLTFLSFLSCSSYKHKSIIQYALPFEVEEEIYSKIDTTGRYVFIISHLDENKYRIHILPEGFNDTFQRIKNSNRFLMINGKAYPVVFDIDFDLGTKTDNMYFKTLKKRKELNVEDYFDTPARNSIILEGLFVDLSVGAIIQIIPKN